MDTQTASTPPQECPLTLGYLVPEFPGQTHIFFWRDLKSLAALGVTSQIISTRKPSKEIISHSWSEKAMRQTIYLSPPTMGLALSGIWEIVRSGPRGWKRILSTICVVEAHGFNKKLRMVGLAAAGGQLAALARQGKWRHLHVHSCADAANVAMFAHLISGLTYSITLHGPLEDYGLNQALKWSNAEFGVVITRKLLKEVVHALGNSVPNTIEIAPMGVDILHFKRDFPFIPFQGEGTFEIFSCGRLNPCKGHDDLIRAVSILKKAGLTLRLRIAGADDTQGVYRALLERLVDESGLGDSVELLGAVPEEVVRKGLETSHVFALASLHEPLGVAIMEAMAMEMPVIATNGGGVTELVDDGVDGLLVPPRNPEALAVALQRIAENPALALSLTVAARTKIVTSFQSSLSAEILHKHLACKKT